MSTEGRFLSASQDQRVKNTVESFEAAEHRIASRPPDDVLRAATKLLVKPVEVIPAFDEVTLSTGLADVWAIDLSLDVSEQLEYSLAERKVNATNLQVTLANPWDSPIPKELTVAHRLSTGMFIVAKPTAGSVSIYKVHPSGIAARNDETVSSALCTLQTLIDGTLADASPAVTRLLHNISPNKIEGTNPNVGGGAMYCLGWPIAGGLYVASPMPWTTEPATVQFDTKWDGDGLSMRRKSATHLPVSAVDDWEVVASLYDCDAEV